MNKSQLLELAAKLPNDASGIIITGRHTEQLSFSSHTHSIIPTEECRLVNEDRRIAKYCGQGVRFLMKVKV